MNANALCWLNGTITPAHQAKVSVFDHGLLYGDGVFEGLRFYNSQVFKLDEHLQRLQRSASAISLNLPFSLDQIRQAITQLIAAYTEDHGYLRLVVTRGIGSLGIDPQKCAQPNLFILADELSVVNTQKPIKLYIASTRRMPAQSLDPAIKSLNYLNNILARIEANNAGMDEALMLNAQGFISEGTVDNIFIVKDRQLLTPQVSDGLLQGITRDVILEIAQQLKITCIETSLTPHDIMQADECFLTGTGAELLVVGQINQHIFPTAEKPLFQTIQQAFKSRVEKDCS